MTAFDRVKFLCEKRKITMVELEERLGFSRNSLYSWKKNNPSADKLTAVADFFNVSTDYLLGRVEYSEWELMDKLYETEIARGAEQANHLKAISDKSFTLPSKRQKSIQDDLDKMIEGLQGMAYSKDTAEMNEETKELLIASLEQAARIARLNASKDK